MGRLENLQGIPQPSQIKFRLVSVGLDSTTNTIHNSGIVSVPVSVAGDFEAELWCNQNSAIETKYRCILPGNGDFFEFDLPVGTTDINISELIKQND